MAGSGLGTSHHPRGAAPVVTCAADRAAGGVRFLNRVQVRYIPRAGKGDAQVGAVVTCLGCCLLLNR